MRKQHNKAPSVMTPKFFGALGTVMTAAGKVQAEVAREMHERAEKAMVCGNRMSRVAREYAEGCDLVLEAEAKIDRAAEVDIESMKTIRDLLQGVLTAHRQLISRFEFCVSRCEVVPLRDLMPRLRDLEEQFEGCVEDWSDGIRFGSDVADLHAALSAHEG